jgi:tryptophan synthase alpha chain
MKGRTGRQRVSDIFKGTRSKGRAAVMPYLTLGYPTPERSLSLVEAAAMGGADLLELGIPFSDPLADGPTIQRATQVALEGGVTVERCLEMAATLRGRGVTVPLIFMGYYNPILAYGEEAFCRACHQVGVDGVIIPDLPPEEGDHLAKGCHEHGLAQIYLLAPTSPPDRIRIVTERSRGFVYLVSITGVTGARDRLPPDLTAFTRRVRRVTDKPLAVGFGISGPDQAAQVAAIADGVIVGSAVLRRAAEADGVDQVRAFVAELRQAVTGA